MVTLTMVSELTVVNIRAPELSSAQEPQPLKMMLTTVISLLFTKSNLDLMWQLMCTWSVAECGPVRDKLETPAIMRLWLMLLISYSPAENTVDVFDMNTSPALRRASEKVKHC